ncbi:phosphodiesterase [Mesorhizobium sp. M1C.F.Ca.ET.193.01.1.1]|nr:phosphodiesterase [Mesorhizobium sp. M1C.F.Ca.ET.210.01.1.1]TGQ65815.1 phosphodiesterase [Mesorhizobium sp. M1C.F.Ca.ET.212.01.1.1]TGQ99760.1 phosphodiesterase [Mesorhizobium sp. M1C.F.Ca.ET.204.01.1.1]TGR20176.1 phosphodiesterase [Mesorhizobium sp. M1C.F.Ca.ET.196.01.1.1]TGR42559.1 phosphodiesterase [Mesorhizobium sp. M1C.F.Ca.ET.195.01.1.1]TGR61601.1 phosphodiesterase [Mesorhizobium sp. M1C.F.Ca.ET.192.01.1.1]TGR74724.1 phosphodiesterase [Mesorhizobium sp. M1C.F.Ca.ET.189.01.1.1]TGR7719
MARHFERLVAGPPPEGRSEAVQAGILRDQLADLRKGIFISMPVGTVLSALILAVQMLSGGGLAAVLWFAAISALNGARLVLALTRSDTADSSPEALGARLSLYGMLSLAAGIAWSCLALLTNGYTTPQAPLYLIVLAGASAGSVTYGTSYAPASINFVTLPLLIAAGCVLANGGTENDILAFTIVLFLAGMVRGALLGQSRFREASRLKYEARAFAAEMERNSRRDPLTNLLNRHGLEHAISRLGLADGPFVAMLIDLDGFKSVNDTYGHNIGDDLLVKVARRIEGHAPEGATIARIGGDEFVLLFPAGSSPHSAGELASAIIAAIANPDPELNSVRVGASIGIYQSDRPRLTEMLLKADFALYAAKRGGRNEYCRFDTELDSALERRHCIERDLRGAIEAGALCSWFQPVLRLDTDAVVGFEALLRWQHPLHGAISPPEIVTAARETGLLSLLTETVFRNCCSMIEELVRQGRRDVRVAMNLSPRELEVGNVDDMILGILKARNVPAAMLEIEITEEAPVDRARVDEKVGRLADAGISIVLDDFGTGFSTLASLKDSRIRKIKIDKDFVRDLAKSVADQALVKAVIDLGRTLGIEVMAEGVETEADRLILRSLGCMIAQGYLFSAALQTRDALAFNAGRLDGSAATDAVFDPPALRSTRSGSAA